MKTLKECIESSTLPEEGMLVKTKSKLGETTGFLIKEKNLKTRKPNTKGKYIGFVPGHGGDVWWIEHENGDVAAYCFDELEDIAKECMKIYILEKRLNIGEFEDPVRYGATGLVFTDKEDADPECQGSWGLPYCVNETEVVEVK
jgi:hypothetical protein